MEETNKTDIQISPECSYRRVAIRDALDVLNGKWKVPIVGALSFGNTGFNELERVIEGITGKMLSKELKDLELNELVTRKEFPTKPITVEYELTAHGKTLQAVIKQLATWGMAHRQQIFKKLNKAMKSEVETGNI